MIFNNSFLSICSVLSCLETRKKPNQRKKFKKIQGAFCSICHKSTTSAVRKIKFCLPRWAPFASFISASS